MGWSIKKPLGSNNSFVRQTVSHPLPAIIGAATGGLGMGLLSGGLAGVGVQDLMRNAKVHKEEYKNAINAANGNGQDSLEQLAADEEAKRRALGLQQQGQINAFADQQQQAAADYHTKLAQSLAHQGQDFFSLENPGILEDLNSRGLFTSQTARDQAQANALKEIALNNNQQLSNFDTSSFNNINDIRGTGLSAMLGGDQSALDAALELRKAGIQHQFDQQAQQAQMSFAQMMAQKQQRQQLLSSIIGLGGSLGGGFLGRA